MPKGQNHGDPDPQFPHVPYVEGSISNVSFSSSKLSKRKKILKMQITLPYNLLHSTTLISIVETL